MGFSIWKIFALAPESVGRNGERARAEAVDEKPPTPSVVPVPGIWRPGSTDPVDAVVTSGSGAPPGLAMVFDPRNA
jgi:hypothetical protein